MLSTLFLNFFEFSEFLNWGDIMDGRTLTRIIDEKLADIGKTQKEFCAELGIQSSAMSAWRKGSMPKPERLIQIEKCLGISFADYEKSDESDELREMLRDRQDLRILLRSAKDVPASSVYALISQLEKIKEDNKN